MGGSNESGSWTKWRCIESNEECEAARSKEKTGVCRRGRGGTGQPERMGVLSPRVPPSITHHLLLPLTSPHVSGHVARITFISLSPLPPVNFLHLCNGLLTRGWMTPEAQRAGPLATDRQKREMLGRKREGVGGGWFVSFSSHVFKADVENSVTLLHVAF